MIGYLVGCPVTNYSIELGRERTEFVESRLQKRLIEQVRACVDAFTHPCKVPLMRATLQPLKHLLTSRAFAYLYSLRTQQPTSLAAVLKSLAAHLTYLNDLVACKPSAVCLFVLNCCCPLELLRCSSAKMIQCTELLPPLWSPPIAEQFLDQDDVDSLALVAVAGISAEGQAYEEVMGQTADLLDLQVSAAASAQPCSCHFWLL